MTCLPRVRTLACLISLTCCTAAAAQTAPGDDAVTLDRVVVNATRLQGVSAFDTPASVDIIGLGGDSNRAGVNLSERVTGVPGLLARDRQNYAQDTQLSIRGFGARSTFGVRGVRLFADGIPATLPDGQGQLSHFNLAAGDRIEIMRGPFSALYGNSSGGVVQIFSARGEAPDRLDADLGAASHDAYSASARLLGARGGFGYNLAGSVFDTAGYRDHSAARRESANAKLSLALGEGGDLDLLFNHLDLDALDPLGLTWAQVQEDPRQAPAAAREFNTRKTVRQDQGGAVLTREFGDGHQLRVLGYTGRRQVVQFLSVPVGAQANPLSAGGVIDLDSDYHGVDARWSWRGELAQRPFEFTAGANLDRQDQHRRGYENFVGETLGVRGALRRDENNEVRNFDQYAQAWWKFAPRWSLLAGVRHSEVEFEARDRFVTAVNPDDSGGVRFRQTTPVAGVMYDAGENLRLYLSAGRGFETPTFNELGYRADGGTGLAFELQPAVSRNLELGAKWRNDAGASAQAALFRADTDDELAVARNVGGRSSFRNVGAARRQGLEASLELPLSAQWGLQLAYTFLDAEFRSDYLVCTGAGCTVPATPVQAGSRIPGVARQQLFARVQWQDGPWSAALEGTGVGEVVVNDIASEAAPGHVLLNLEASRQWTLAGGTLRGFVRVDNLLDKAHVGSVIVNEGNGRFYEPGLDRTLLVGAQWRGSR
jgi:iron complex outermembrane receptor protein